MLRRSKGTNAFKRNMDKYWKDIDIYKSYANTTHHVTFTAKAKFVIKISKIYMKRNLDCFFIFC